MEQIIYMLVNLAAACGVLFGIFMTIFFIWMINLLEKVKKFKHDQLCPKCRDKTKYHHELTSI